MSVLPTLRSAKARESILPYICAIPYEEGQSNRTPRFEIKHMPISIARVVLKWRAPCVHCEELMYPLRVRKEMREDERRTTASGVYLALACPVSSNPACQRGKAVTNGLIYLQGLLEELEYA